MFSISMNDEMVAYGEYYISKVRGSWEVTKSGRDKSVLFSGSYDECIAYCKALKK